MEAENDLVIQLPSIMILYEISFFNMQKRPPVSLIQCATPWSMIHWPTQKKEWSLERKLAEIKKAGFDGVAATATPKIGVLARKNGLRIMGGMLALDLEYAKEQLEIQSAAGAEVINIQLLRHDAQPKEAAALAVKILKVSLALNAGAHIESHRDTCTETPEKLTEIARLYRARTGSLLPVTWDHSHLGVMKHIQPDKFVERLLVWPALIKSSRLFHLRPFNAQHCQIPVTNGRGKLTPEFRDYLAFVEELFVLWISGQKEPAALWVCPELGMTHGYHVSTNPPVWPDTVRARSEYERAWARAINRISA